jgi:hypothetical protein
MSGLFRARPAVAPRSAVVSDDAYEESRFRRYALEIGAVTTGLILIGVAVYTLHVALPDFRVQQGESTSSALERAVSTLNATGYNTVLGIVALLVGVVAILLAFYRIFEVDTRETVHRDVRLITNDLTAEIAKGRPVRLADTPDDIWETSVQLLEQLATHPHHDRYAYDMSTYLNKVRYEEAVVRVLNSRISFRRAFCYRVSDQGPADKAVQWFFESIVNGTAVTEDTLRDLAAEVLSALKDHEADVQPAEITPEIVGRLNQIVQAQHEAYRRGRLNVTAIQHRMPVDFVATEYTPFGTESRVYEVMANLKTDPAGDTYVVGTYARGALASGYVGLYKNMVETGKLA